MLRVKAETYAAAAAVAVQSLSEKEAQCSAILGQQAAQVTAPSICNTRELCMHALSLHAVVVLSLPCCTACAARQNCL